MRKLTLILALLLLVAMCAMTFASCDNEPAQSDAPSTAESVPATSEATSDAESAEESVEESIPLPPVVEYAPQDVEIDKTLTKTLITTGCTYTCPDSDRTDGYVDAAKTKLTDGNIPGASGNDASYFGMSSSAFDVVVDLGEKVSGLAEFAFSTASGNWGISAPTSVQYFVSDDGETWLPVADAIFTTEIEPVASEDPWMLYDYTLTLDKGVSGRYIKFSVDNTGHVWVGEVCAYVYK